MKNVLITAGGTGIGKKIAEKFADKSYNVWVCDIDEASLKRVSKNWRTSLVDVSNEEKVKSLFEQIAKDWGRIDTVCCNAGIAGPTSPIEEVSLVNWQNCLAVNLEGAFLTTKYAIPLMKKKYDGSILFTSSTAGVYGYPNRSPYSAAKWGVIGFMKTLAMELGPFGIRSNAVCPGSVEGPRMDLVIAREAKLKGLSKEQVYKGYAESNSMRSFVQDEDIANMMVFLASDDAKFVSGQVISVDGHTENPDPKI
tara:strand:+ start:398 stop:1156 length:759 start_codon:yes stop_codon:yes gene_type:complete